MKLSAQQMISLLPCETGDADAMESGFRKALGDLPEKYFVDGILAGWLKMTRAAKDGIPAYCLVYQVLGGSRCHFLYMEFIGNGKIDPNDEIWQTAAEMITRENNCSEMSTAVHRQGSAAKMLRWGAEAVAVTFRKTLKPAINTAEEKFDEVSANH